MRVYNVLMGLRRTVLVVIAPIVALSVLGAGPATAASRCEASVHAQLTHVERKELVTTHTYTVDATTQETCARIRFALYTTERISKKKVKVFETDGEVRLRDGSISTILNYDMPNGRELVRWEVKLTGCERCEP